MRIVLQSKLSRGEVHEGSAFTLTAKFYDDSSDPWTLSAPSAIRYKINDLSSGNTVADWTAVAPASSVSISITAAQNAVVNPSLQSEQHEIVVQANDGLSTQYAESFRWHVLNATGIQ